MDSRTGSGDAVQRARLARILSDPARYFDEARRSAHDEARRELAERLHDERPADPR